MQKVTGNVYVGTNVCNHSFVQTNDGVVMIDAPAVPSAALAWRNAIAGHGPVRYLVTTEGHVDHFGGDYFFDAPIVAHEGTRAAIRETPMEYFMEMIASASPGEALLPDGFFFSLPTVAFSEALTLYVGGHAFRLLHMPGHTPFQAVVHVPEERVVFTGDNVVNKTMPFFHQAMPTEWLESLDRLMELDVDAVIPGHGPVGDKRCIPEMRETVQIWMDAVRSAIDKGMTSEEAQAAISLLDRYPDPRADDAKRSFFQRRSIARLYEALQGG
jgi:glyoxylase-like metal-dependent hydrolase (beta-lactamase superfamily II)